MTRATTPATTRAMTRPPSSPSDLELMEHADGELDDPELAARLELDPDARARLEAIQEVGELVRGHLELSADGVHDARFAAMWRRIDERIAPATGLWARISGWLDRHRGHVITGVVSAGAVAALALVLRPGNSDLGASGAHAIEVRPVALRAAPEIDSLDTPGGSSTVLSLNDDDGNAAVIWVTPDDDTEAL